MLCCDTSYQPLIGKSNSRSLAGVATDGTPVAKIRRAATNADIVQFTTAIYYVEEDEEKLVVDVMRLGSMKGTVKVSTTLKMGRQKREFPMKRPSVS